MNTSSILAKAYGANSPRLFPAYPCFSSDRGDQIVPGLDNQCFVFSSPTERFNELVRCKLFNSVIYDACVKSSNNDPEQYFKILEQEKSRMLVSSLSANYGPIVNTGELDLNLVAAGAGIPVKQVTAEFKNGSLLVNAARFFNFGIISPYDQQVVNGVVGDVLTMISGDYDILEWLGDVEEHEGSKPLPSGFDEFKVRYNAFTNGFPLTLTNRKVLRATMPYHLWVIEPKKSNIYMSMYVPLRLDNISKDDMDLLLTRVKALLDLSIYNIGKPEVLNPVVINCVLFNAYGQRLTLRNYTKGEDKLEDQVKVIKDMLFFDLASIRFSRVLDLQNPEAKIEDRKKKGYELDLNLEISQEAIRILSVVQLRNPEGIASPIVKDAIRTVVAKYISIFLIDYEKVVDMILVRTRIGETGENAKNYTRTVMDTAKQRVMEKLKVPAQF